MTMILIFCQYAEVRGQSNSVSGIVKDQDGSPLIGVTVKVKGGTNGISTDAGGKFKIPVESFDETLLFSYLGFENKEVSIAGKRTLNVVLTVSSSKLNEVVVIGYGTVLRKDITGAIGSVDIADLKGAPVKSFDEALAGRVAGVQVTSAEGQPGSTINITIRGNNSITQTNYPLFVIDGFPFEDANNGAVNPLNTINPNDIESIDVLKDASATAIYGARGANGVIMVTTKRGKAGKSLITYNGYLGSQENNKRLAVLSPYEFVNLQNEIDPVKTKELYFKDGRTLEDYRNVKGINWEDQVTRKALMTDHYLSLAGGSDKTKYSASLSHTNQNGIIMNSGFARTQGRLSLDQQVSDRLKVGLNANYAYIKTYGSPTSTGNFSNEINLMFNVWAFRPLAVSPEVNLLDLANDPEVEQASNFTFNPVLTSKNELREHFSNNLNANGFAEYSFSKELKLKVLAGINRGNREFELFNGSMSRSGIAGNYLVNGSKTIYTSSGWQNANTLTYSKRLNARHYFDVMGGFTLEGGKSSAFGATSVLLPSESLGISGLDEGTPLAITSLTGEWSAASFIGRANYKLSDRYLFTASMRADGSSRFIGNNKWGYFPSAAFGWQINNETFMKNLTYVSNAKLRLSWGVTGNNRFSDFAAYPALFSINTDVSYPINNSPGYMFNNADSKGVVYTSLGNKDLKWEVTGQTNLGLDLGFFKDRLTLGVDLYRKNTRDLLLNATLSPSTGYNRGMKNIGKVRNEGLEISASVTPLKSKNFNWTSNFNIAFNRNEILELAENQTYLPSVQSWGDDWKNITGYVARIGEPIAQFYGLVYDGVYKYEDFVQVGNTYTLKGDVTANGGSGSASSVKPGDAKYRDMNGDLIINESDKVVIGDPNPVHVGGLSNNLRFKNFDLGVFFQWSYGNDIINANRILFESAYKYGYNQYATYVNRWSPENQDSDIPGAGSIRGSSLKSYSTRIIEDGSFLRLKTVSLGYTLPANLLKRVKINTFRVFVSAQNLYTWTNYSGYDPEVSVRNSALTPGFDYSAYPRARTITFGLNTSF
ncbi:SusC/RagA family TonB-linked outer membrane protein [Desertivirga xinjiangensis]|uniref:SusC/RagA family TonB-linked outer membrane protein n=1 Tax=Desertivirga xinjiangensis TaxID=539206 RepID=UPI0034E2A624